MSRKTVFGQKFDFSHWNLKNIISKNGLRLASLEAQGGSWFVFNGKINFLRETVKSNNISERSNFKSIRGTKIFLKKYSRCKVFAVFLFLKMLSLFKYSRSDFLKSIREKVFASDNF